MKLYPEPKRLRACAQNQEALPKNDGPFFSFSFRSFVAVVVKEQHSSQMTRSSTSPFVLSSLLLLKKQRSSYLAWCGQPDDCERGMVRTTAKFRQIQLEKTDGSIENLFLDPKTTTHSKRVFLATKTCGNQ